MTDIEKAISLLQQCLDERPYASVRVNQIMSCIQETVDLLKEQEPVTIKRSECGCDEIYSDIAHCPECGMEWAMWEDEKMKYCPGCGRRVKWDE